jgi:ribosomal protein S12 methylthiotransferase accessory factor
MTRLSKRHREGTHRLITPEETIARVRRLMPVMGITRIANVTGLDTLGIPVVTVSRPNARSVSVAQGKGLTLAAAKASGLMESIESYHAEHAHMPLVRASYNELRFNRPMVDVTALPRSSASSFHDNSQILWAEGSDLLSGTALWLPFELVHTNFTLPLPAGSGSFLMNSNGLASGNHALEAISHGVCEVVERDCTTLWHCSSEAAKERTRLDLSTVDDPGCLEVLEKYEKAGVMVAVWETTSDVGIPSFLCTIVERSHNRLRPLPAMNGMGCHPAREVALLRALTEAAQGRMTMITGSRDDLRQTSYAEAQDLDFLGRMERRMRASGPERSFNAVPTWNGETFEDDIAWELQRLQAAGMKQVAVVDLTKREFGIAVVRVVIPGLEPIHDVPGYTSGPRARQRLMEHGA